MGSHTSQDKKGIVVFCALATVAILTMQLVAATAWTADSANQGPAVVILQLSDDANTNWAVADLVDRLSGVIVDDPYIVDRLVVRKISNPTVAVSFYQSIVIYMSHGGPFGIVTGNRLTSWKTMADIVTESSAKMHLFAACDSRNIISYGSEDSGKKLYTVPGARPAEVINVEITATVMLALGYDAQVVEEFRISELTTAKALVQSGRSVHIMDFEQIILSEIEAIDASYSDTYTSSYRVVRKSVNEMLLDVSGWSELPLDLKLVLANHYGYYSTQSGEVEPLLPSAYINYTKNYYYVSTWEEDPPLEGMPPTGEYIPVPGDADIYSSEYMQIAAYTPGHWVNGSDVFTGGTYAGFIIFEGSVTVVVNVTASGPTLDGQGKTEVDSISLSEYCPRGLYVQQQKVDDVWQEPVIGRNPARSGGLWTDPAVKADYEYDSNWPTLPHLDSSMKEDAEDGDTSNWGVYDNSPPGYIYNVADNNAHGRVISLVGGGTNTGYRYPYSSASYWNDAEHKSIQWSMKYSEAYYVFVSCDTTAGHRYIYYSNVDTDYLITSPGYVHHGLGSWTTDGVWHIFTRDLQNDLHDAEPYVNINDVNAILFRGSGKVDDIILLHTDHESTGDISSDGEYIYLDDIPTEDGWHGPSFVRTLPSYFEVNDFGSFSANLSLVHAGYNSRIGMISISLFDESKKIVASLQLGDMWGAESKQYFYVYYFFADGSFRSHKSSAFYGNTSGIVGIHYNPRMGMYADVPGDNSTRIVPRHLLDQDRLIKYVAIQSYRCGSSPEHDERIYNVRLSYAGSEYTVFHDTCNDMDEFHVDPSFSNGVLEVPEGESYMTWSSIDSGSGWHGPKYVHALDRPFRLYQLYEFSVLGELIQGAGSEMGITSVALLDNYGDTIMAIEWGDDANGWNDGWFRAVFYPENGGQYTRTLWYGEDSYAVTISMWWDPATGQGSIYTSSSDIPYNYLVHAVYNASRVVYSMVIEGLRYGSNPLLEMRIHNITLLTDLSRQDPNNPGEEQIYDGSGYPTEVNKRSADSLLSDGFGSVDTEWTGPWPLFHLYIDHIVEHPETTYHIQAHNAKNLLGITEYSSCTVDGDPSFMGPADEDDEWMAWNLDNVAPEPLMFGIGMASGTLEWAIKGGANPIIVTLAAAALTFQALLAVSLPLTFAAYMVGKGEWSNMDAGRFILEVALSYLKAAAPFFIFWVIGQAMAAGVMAAVFALCEGLEIIAAILHFLLIANIVILAIAIALSVAAGLWFAGLLQGF